MRDTCREPPHGTALHIKASLYRKADAGVGPSLARSVTWYFHLQQGEKLQEEDGDPAEGVSEDDEEESLGDGHFPGEDAALSRLGGCGVDGVEHAGVGEHDGDEGNEVQTWGGQQPAMSVSESQPRCACATHGR